MVELRQDLSRNFRWAVWWSVANACYLVWLFRFIKHFSITLLYYLCKIIHILLFITTNIWLQHNPAYSGCHLDTNEILVETNNMQIGCWRSLVLILLLHNLYFREWNLYLLVVKIQEVFIIFAFSRKKVRKINKKRSNRQKITCRLKAVTKQDFFGIQFAYYFVSTRIS